MKAASYLGWKVPAWPRRELQITDESPNEHVGSPAPEKGSCGDKTCMSHKVALHGRNGLLLSCGPGPRYHTGKAHGSLQKIIPGIAESPERLPPLRSDRH